MIIKKVLVGNEKEAFIEDRFSNKINIISSDDNNKGKTIVIQSIMYALGNDPIFPSSFKYKDYYYAVEFEIENIGTISIGRKGHSFAVIFRENLSVFDNLSELKFFLNKNIFHIPSILKDGYKKLVDPMLFYQIFFVGQDNKNTSNIFHPGYYKKEDFINMLYSYSGIEVSSGVTDIENLKKQIKNLEKEKKEIEKNNKILKSAFPEIGIVSNANDRAKFEAKIVRIETLKNFIISFNSKRNQATARKVKNEITLKELRSLNKTLSAGKLHCLDCNSTDIGYSTADNSYTFDISSVEMRNQILSSIEDKIALYEEEINMITIEINKLQNELKLLLTEEDVTIENLLLYKTDLVQASEADSKLILIDNQLKYLNAELVQQGNSFTDLQEKKTELYNRIIEEMNNFYNEVDPQGNMQFTELFSKKQSVFSGVEETEYYLSKIYSILSVLKHPFPIIMDYFRDGELSSKKEDKVLELLGNFNNQVILTATLKDEEFGKYDQKNYINHINYTLHTPSKLLSLNYVDEFLKYMSKFSLIIS
ncbi:hypothetical protein [Paenibacillus amylolyticus]|uniref:hypothetical protein n=1 Tax=Paenibacillus amylolyticus TaxID=1451 RepID=UPI00096F547E|nr:hypothetical protein [Paenibacillus amylolyticus]OMF45421.1 hypothetical protein BK136_09985 [Paenibacillus amylolyticus]